MGFSLTSPAPEKGDPTAEKRVWGFFGETQQSHRENRPQPKQPRQGNPPSLTKIVSGRTYWPSRDPIGERGGVNLYGMVGNDAVNLLDRLGLDPMDALNDNVEGRFVNFTIESQVTMHTRIRQYTWDSVTNCCKHSTPKLEGPRTKITKMRLYYYLLPLDLWGSLEKNGGKLALDKFLGKLASSDPRLAAALEGAKFANDVMNDMEIPVVDREKLPESAMILKKEEASVEYRKNYVLQMDKITYRNSILIKDADKSMCDELQKNI